MARQYLEDVVGPDGVRVTIAVEPDVERVARFGSRLGGHAVLTSMLRALGPAGTWAVRPTRASG